MNAAEKREIEAMFRQQADDMVGRLDASFKAHVDTLKGDFKAHVGILSEDFQHKLDLVVEGHEVLRREIREVGDESHVNHEQTAFLLKAVSNKVDGIATDLAAHRKDTEAHGAVWGVKDGGE